MNTLRLTDLAHPLLSAKEQALVDSARPAPLTVEALLAAARQRAGLENFGAMDFVERLALWLQCVREDRGLNDFGRAAAFEQYLRYATTRLRIEDLLARHPEILSIPLPRPVIVAGMPRSGTTHLVNALATSPALRSMKLWEVTEPVPQPGEPVSFTDGDSNPRYKRSSEAWYVFTSILEHMPSMHEMAPDHIHEELELQAADFTSYVPDWLVRSERWKDYYFGHDQTPHYAYARKVVQAMTWYHGPNRWLMKSPTMMECLPEVMRTYPDATLVITHRDPLAVIQSAITMIAYWDRIRRNEADLPALAGMWIDRIERTLRRCVEARDHLPPGQVMDVLFHDWMADERGTVESVYRLAGMPVTAADSQRIDSYLANNRRGKHRQVIYDLAGDFGVDIAALRRRFEFYYERFPVRREAVTGE